MAIFDWGWTNERVQYQLVVDVLGDILWVVFIEKVLWSVSKKFDGVVTFVLVLRISVRLMTTRSNFGKCDEKELEISGVFSKAQFL